MSRALFCIRQWEWWAMIPFAIFTSAYVCVTWVVVGLSAPVRFLSELAIAVHLWLGRAALRYPPMVRMQGKLKARMQGKLKAREGRA